MSSFEGLHILSARPAAQISSSSNAAEDGSCSFLGCLKTCWEAIRNFFQTLAGCLCCESQNDIRPPASVPRVVQIQTQPQLPKVATKPSVGPLTSPHIQPSSQGAAARSVPGIAAAVKSTVVAPPPVKPFSPPKWELVDDIPEDDIPELEEIMDPPASEDAPNRSEAPVAAVAVPRKSAVAFFDEQRQNQVLPSQEEKRERESNIQASFEALSPPVVKVDPNGRISPQLQLNGAEEAFKRELETLSQKISSPQDIPIFIELAEKRVEAFNTTLVQQIEALKEVKTIRPPVLKKYDATSFFDNLQKLGAQWELLESLAQVESYKDSHLDSIQKVSKELVCDKASEMYGPLKALIEKMQAKPIVSQQIDPFRDPLGVLAKKFDLEAVEPQSAYDVLKRQYKEFVTKLHADFEASINQVENLKIEDFRALLGKAEEQLTSYTRELQEKLSSLPQTASSEIEFQPEDPAVVFAVLKKFSMIWGGMEKLSTDLMMDQKITYLTRIAESIEEIEDVDLHRRYKKIKEGLEISLMPLGLAMFANRTLNVIDEEDKKRYTQIQNSFDRMAKKLGCPAPKAPEIVMDDTNDAFIMESEMEQNCATLALDVEQNYNSSLQFGAPVAAGSCVEQIRLATQAYPPELKIYLIQRTLELITSKAISKQIENEIHPFINTMITKMSASLADEVQQLFIANESKGQKVAAKGCVKLIRDSVQKFTKAKQEVIIDKTLKALPDRIAKQLKK